MTSSKNGAKVQSRPLHSVTEMLTATKIGRYEVLGELGRGGMGVVYRAKDPVIGRTVAIKTIRITEEGTGMSHAQLVERFQTEARAAGLLAHPNIVVIHDAGETSGEYYITMELVNGKSLQSLLDSSEKFPVARLLQIMEQVCSALAFAHDHNVVHRDIKPANIMLTGDDFVKITDFGTAKILQYGSAQQTSAMGTPGYMSPEQIKGKAIDGRSDIFSLGVMLYEMATGQKPFPGRDIAAIFYQILNEEPAPPHQLNSSIPLGVSSAIMKALAKSPHLRYENCRDLLEDLKYYRPGGAKTNEGGEATPARVTPQRPLTHSIPQRTPANLTPLRLGANPTPQRLPAREKSDKHFHAEMPRIPGVEPRPVPPAASSRAEMAAPSNEAEGNGHSPADAEHESVTIYSGPETKVDPEATKRTVKIAVGVLLALILSSFGFRTLRNMQRSDSDTLPTMQASQDNTPSSQSENTETDSAEKALYVTQANPQVATLGELARLWSSKKFFFRSLTLSKNVPAVIIRLPGPSSEARSYWALSLEAPFSQCEFEYIDDLAKLSSEYGLRAAHPMVVSPCSHAVFDPLRFKELPGNILVRGAIVQGYDLRPPLGIEVKVSGNRIDALAME